MRTLRVIKSFSAKIFRPIPDQQRTFLSWNEIGGEDPVPGHYRFLQGETLEIPDDPAEFITHWRNNRLKLFIGQPTKEILDDLITRQYLVDDT